MKVVITGSDGVWHETEEATIKDVLLFIEYRLANLRFQKLTIENDFNTLEVYPGNEVP